MMRGFSILIAVVCLFFGAGLSAGAFGQTADNDVCVPECRLPSGERISVGDTLHDQRKILFGGARELARDREGVADLYFIGLAGDGTQDVFLKEVRYARSLFDERFDTGARSLILANNPKSLDTIALANIDNLRLAIRWMARVMDTDEDVLFLFLTSHGTRGHEFVLNFPPFEFEHIRPETLRTLLDRAGIKWRVIVISACYSGGFVDPLKTENSLIITAARADRTSFGCSAEADFTYFGRAYFDEALYLRKDFIEAFEIAKNTIEKRESAAGFPQSEPQIHIGAGVESKLEQIESRLQRRDVAGP